MQYCVVRQIFFSYYPHQLVIIGHACHEHASKAFSIISDHCSPPTPPLSPSPAKHRVAMTMSRLSSSCSFRSWGAHDADVTVESMWSWWRWDKRTRLLLAVKTWPREGGGGKRDGMYKTQRYFGQILKTLVQIYKTKKKGHIFTKMQD